MNARTPLDGPWHVSAPSGIYGWEVRYKTGEKLYGIECSDLVCMLPHGPRKPEYETVAKLISAAPEMLASLQFLVDAAETEPGMAIYRAHIEQARAVITKAKGGAP